MGQSTDMANDVASRIAEARKVLAKANNLESEAGGPLPSSRPKPAPAPKATPKPSSPSYFQQARALANGYGEAARGIRANAQNVDQYANAPKMHNGGPVLQDGVYRLKKGEHVLTPREVSRARNHAMVAAGMKSLVKAGSAQTAESAQGIPQGPSTAGEPSEAVKKSGSMSKRSTGHITVRPERNQGGPAKNSGKKSSSVLRSSSGKPGSKVTASGPASKASTNQIKVRPESNQKAKPIVASTRR